MKIVPRIGLLFRRFTDYFTIYGQFPWIDIRISSRRTGNAITDGQTHTNSKNCHLIVAPGSSRPSLSVFVFSRLVDTFILCRVFISVFCCRSCISKGNVNQVLRVTEFSESVKNLA
jgi:hypothetical protein